MKFSCGVTLFYPSENELRNLEKLISTFDTFVVYDNTDDLNISNSNRDFFNGYQRVQYFGNAYNEGLSVAFNKMCNIAYDLGSEYICLMDQDSLFEVNEITKIMRFIANSQIKDVAIYAPTIKYIHERKNEVAFNSSEYKEIDWAISSGSFLNIEVFKRTSGFDENYFIDRLDFDYCKMVKQSGFKTIEVSESCLIQNLGEAINVFGFSISQHNALRHYYMFRNRLYYYKKKSNGNKDRIKLHFASIRQIIKIIIFEKEKVEKIRYIKKAVDDYHNNNMGKY